MHTLRDESLLTVHHRTVLTRLSKLADRVFIISTISTNLTTGVDAGAQLARHSP